MIRISCLSALPKNRSRAIPQWRVKEWVIGLCVVPPYITSLIPWASANTLRAQLDIIPGMASRGSFPGKHVEAPHVARVRFQQYVVEVGFISKPDRNSMQVILPHGFPRNSFKSQIILNSRILNYFLWYNDHDLTYHVAACIQTVQTLIKDIVSYVFCERIDVINKVLTGWHTAIQYTYAGIEYT